MTNFVKLNYMKNLKFAQRLNLVLKSAKISQKELAKQLNISEGNISNWKKGLNLPSVEILFNLCTLLDESADYLLGLED